MGFVQPTDEMLNDLIAAQIMDESDKTNIPSHVMDEKIEFRKKIILKKLVKKS